MSKQILIVDDDSDLRTALDARLRARGYQTAFAADGALALTEARKCDPDLILLDLGLPAGDGFVTLERLKGHPDLSAVPVIVLSARDAHGNEKRTLDAGAFAYFEKPADDQQLLDAIARAIRATR